ncbi:beta-ketoacyl synthase N-terminal-like domain-containing protein [Streptomyces sp. NPDC050264]|uniref:beta-ketoacyl synthase N-terminal-like domain-containing protein n=1 Tax=Streptomyces sp. NPDC050264 TaxID=3155038 RepID=UPI003426A109
MNGTRERVARTVAALLGGTQVDAEVPLPELGLTSLLAARLRLRLEREFGRAVPAAVLTEHYTVRALARYLDGDGARPAPPAARVDPPVTVDRRVAVIGMAARLPGAPDIDAFWQNLQAGVCSVGEPLADADAFDAAFFGMSPREAERTDPAHRLLLESCYHALEDGGCPEPDEETRVAVFAGTGMNLYGPQAPHFLRDGSAADPLEAVAELIGGQGDFLATRVAWHLGLTGPAVTVQSACSTSLVAVHMAVQALLTGDADLALAGAAAVRRTPVPEGPADPEYILSPSGVVRAFDVAADGTVGGDGVGVVLLKPLARALADGDTVHAVILGSAVTNDGHAKAGFTAPSVRGHAAAVRHALERAGAEPQTIGYLEAHGTGTAVGDPVEFRALTEALAGPAPGGTARTGLGSVKPSVGHLDTCAGMAGLIKTVLMLRHGELVPTVNSSAPDPRLAWSRSPFFPVTERAAWPAGSGPRRAGVSALGFGGTNAHVVLEEPPVRATVPDGGREALVPLAAPDEASLRRRAAQLRDWLRGHDGLRAGDVARRLHGRPPRPAARLAVAGRTAAEIADALDAALAREWPGEPPLGPPAFAFRGQGAGAWDTGAHRDDPVVRAVVEPFAEVLDRPQAAHLVWQVAHTRRWERAGVEPACVVGHSLGELAALCAAGALTPADAVRFTLIREELTRSTRPGRMLAISAPLEVALDAAAGTGADLAAHNAPTSHTLSGPDAVMDRAESWLDARAVPFRALPMTTAYHSHLMEPVMDRLAGCARDLDWRPLRVPWASAADGELLPAGTTPDPDCLVRQVRYPVLFDPALRALGATGTRDFVEIAPTPVLRDFGRRVLPDSAWYLWGAAGLAALHRRGAALDFAALNGPGPRAPLPGFPFTRQRFPW